MRTGVRLRLVSVKDSLKSVRDFMLLADVLTRVHPPGPAPVNPPVTVLATRLGGPA